MVSPLARRAQVIFARERGLSLRRACGLIGMPHATPSYRPRMPAKDAPVVEAMKELSYYSRLRHSTLGHVSPIQFEKAQEA